MTREESKYPWWARSTGGNRGYALLLAIMYTLLFAGNTAVWLTKSEVWVGLVALGFLLLAGWAWAVVVYLHRRSDSTGDHRGW